MFENCRSRPRRSACSRRRSPRARPTRTSSTGRRASGSAGSPWRSPPSCSASTNGSARASHPDLYVLEPLGDQIRIDAIRELRRDLHMRPFEADRRVYLFFGAHSMNEEAADALLKDLEEPPPYAVIVLVADELGPLPETIRSRCQPVPFRRLSERAVRAVIEERRAGALGERDDGACARRRPDGWTGSERLLDPEGGRAALRPARARARGLPRRRSSCRRRAAEFVTEAAGESGAARRRPRRRRSSSTSICRPARGSSGPARGQRGAEREELLLMLEELAAWYRDLVVVRGRGRGCGRPLRPPRRAPRGRDTRALARPPNAPPSSSARPGGRSRSSTSSPVSRSKRSSSTCGARSPPLRQWVAV